jgi:fructose-1,6-bisphosphatase/inositol monophosphatase family enzyme
MNVNEIIIEAGKILVKRYYENQIYSVKERYHLLSEIDIEMNEFIIGHLTAISPDTSIQSEESELIGRQSNRKWILDPIDGTTNFIMGNPYFAISLALTDNDEVMEAHVHNPLSNEYYFAKAQIEGAFLNGQTIKVSKTHEINEALIAFGYSANMKIINEYYEQWSTIFDNCRKGIGWVAPALSICNVARGRVDAFIDTGCSIYGQTAASLILKKAGGEMYDNDFEKYSYKTKGAIFCSSSISQALKNAIKGKNTEDRAQE